LTELMIALVLGAIVVLAATAMVVTSRATYRTQDEGTRVAESGRFALELVNRMVRLAGYTDFGDATQTPPAYVPSTWSSTATGAVILPGGPNLVGADNIYLSGNLLPSASATLATSPGLGDSDMLVVRYYGSGVTGAAADGNVLDCAGIAVPAAPNVDPLTNLNNRDFNVLYVKPDPSDSEPTLYCARYTYDATTGALSATSDQQALIRGVESFQVLYGELQYSAGPPPADPDLVPPLGVVYRTGIGGANPVVDWNKVISVRIGMLIRSNTGAQPDSTATTYNLFGTAYPGSGDPGTQFNTTTLSTAERTRIRRVFQTTVFVRNRLSPWPSLQ
jgi:type IV pilus assembly protein PilW